MVICKEYLKPFIEEYNWKDIDFPSTSQDWTKFELNNEVAATGLEPTTT